MEPRMSDTPPTTQLTGQAPQASWASVAQPGELRFYAQHPHFDVDAFVAAQWARYGFSRNAFTGQVVIDLGCGPTVQAAWFTGLKKLIAVDPLASLYRQQVPWHRLSLAHEVHTSPAETFIPSLVFQADSLISRNALDHGYDFAASVNNIAAYIKPGGFAFLTFDCHASADPLHQLCLTPELCERCYAASGLTVEKHTSAPPHWFGVAHNWWLRKAHT
jgi:hypothetical protein